MKHTNLNISGLTVRIELHDDYETLKMPQSYQPFESHDKEAAPAVTLRVRSGVESMRVEGEAVACGMNDLGEARLYQSASGYVVRLRPNSVSGFRTMQMNEDFSAGEVLLPANDEYARFTIDSMLRILFSQAVVKHHGFMLHSAAVVKDGEGVLLMGKSGTGKSTHARLWLREFANTWLLNDDNPVVRIAADGRVWAYGSPWSGKTPCYRREGVPVRAFVRLEQAPEDRYEALKNIDAFVAMLPGVSVITHSRELYGQVCSTLVETVERVKVGRLRCTATPNAARTLCSSV